MKDLRELNEKLMKNAGSCRGRKAMTQRAATGRV
jgi:hypothetical protein